jgi:hypothetical protein
MKKISILTFLFVVSFLSFANYLYSQNWSSVSAGNCWHTIAIKTDGTLWVWGDNFYGQLGLGDTTNRYTPTKVGTDTNWAYVSAGCANTIAIKTDGTLWAWGWNYTGQLGLGDTTNRYTPTQVGSDTNWAYVSAGDSHTVAIKKDGTLWAWGDNFYGQLGLGDTTDRYTPTLVGSDTNWAYVSAGLYHTIAIKTNGTLWAWGRNNFGQLGLGDTTNRYSPTLVNIKPTLSWTNETNYTSDGLDPEKGTSTTIFTYRVKYTDADNGPPAFGYPKVHIKKGGVEIAGSPFTMTEVDSNDTNYTDGKIYTYSTTLLPGSNYSYYFEAYDIYYAMAPGTPPINAPNVNDPPSLSWTGEAGYENDGVNPDSASTSNNFIFKVKYSDIDNDSPASGYPKLHILKNGIEISGSPFSMTCSGSNYSSGVICSYSIVFTSTGTDYSYYFEAKDNYNQNATGMPTTSKSGPTVTNQAPVLSWTGEPGYENDGINSDSGDIFIFKIKYTDTDNDSPLTAYPKLHILKNGVEISNSPFTMNYISGSYNSGAIYSYTIFSLEGGEYSYYFEAKDTYGLSAVGEPTLKKTFASIKNIPQINDAKIYHGVFKPLQGEKVYISFSPTTTGKTTIKVYNTEGKEVKKLYEGTSTPGLNTITWDGTDESGKKLPSGVYLITIDAPGFKKSKKVVIVR